MVLKFCLFFFFCYSVSISRTRTHYWDFSKSSVCIKVYNTSISSRKVKSIWNWVLLLVQYTKKEWEWTNKQIARKKTKRNYIVNDERWMKFAIEPKIVCVLNNISISITFNCWLIRNLFAECFFLHIMLAFEKLTKEKKAGAGAGVWEHKTQINDYGLNEIGILCHFVLCFVFIFPSFVSVPSSTSFACI